MAPDPGDGKAIRTFRIDRDTGDRTLEGVQPIDEEVDQGGRLPTLKAVKRDLPGGKTVGEALGIPDRSSEEDKK